MQSGLLYWVKQSDFDNLPNCYGNNPVSPYGVVMLPRGHGENTNDKEWGKLVE